MRKKSFLFPAILLGSALTVAAQPFDSLFTPSGGFSAWSNGRAIKLNTSATGANVAATVTGIPILIRLNATETAVFTGAKAGGADLRFSKPDMTPLPYQIERWDATNKRAEIWVLADSVYGNSTAQRIYMYWGNAGAADSSNGKAVFDTTNKYQGVWHLAQASGSQFDATQNAINGGDSGTAGSNGIAGRGRTFSPADGETSRYIDLGNNATLNARVNNTHTIEAWVRNVSQSGTFHTIFGQSDGITFRIAEESRSRNYEAVINGNYDNGSISSMADTNQWIHLVMVDSARYARIFRNGVRVMNGTTQRASVSHTSTTGGGNYPWAIGAWYYATSQCPDGPCRNWVGDIDEVRVSSVQRSDGYIKLSYENQKPLQAFANIGIFVATAPEAPANVTGTAGNAEATLSWTAPDNGGSAIISYKVMVVGDTAKACFTTGALTCTVTGLTNGTGYTFVVRANNAVGVSPLSQPSATLTPAAATVPGAPTGVLAAASTSVSGQAIVGWSPPSSNGGSPITLHTATASPGGATCTSSTTDYYCYVNGLTQGTSYTFTVRATNAVGQGPASTPSSAILIPTALLPGNFRISVNGTGNPYTFEVSPLALANTQRLTMTIRDSRGRTVWSHSLDPSRSQIREITWDGKSTGGSQAAAGMYLVHVSVIRNGRETNLMERTVTLKP